MTVWVIIAIVLVASIVLFFAIEKNPKIFTKQDSFNINGFVESCVGNQVQQGEEIMFKQGGFIEKQKDVMYLGENVTYLCYNSGSYNTCVNQHPALIDEMRLELKNFLAPRVEDCFSELKTELEKRNEIVEYGETNTEVGFVTGKILIDINKTIELEKNGEKSRTEGFEIQRLSPLYELANVAIEISNYEAKYCYFEYVGYMVLHQGVSIEKYALDDGTKIYTLTDKKSGKNIKIAVRSCAIPPGF